MARKLTELLNMMDHDEKCVSLGKNRNISVEDADDFICAVELDDLDEESLEAKLLDFRTWIVVRDSLPKSEFVQSMSWPSLDDRSVKLRLPSKLQVSTRDEAKFRQLVELFDELVA